MVKLYFFLLLVFLLQCSTAFAARTFSGQWLNQLDIGTDSQASVIETTLYIDQRGKLICGSWKSYVTFNQHISIGHIVGEVSGNSAKIIFSDNLRDEDGLESNYKPSKTSLIYHLSLKGSQLYAKHKGYGPNHKIKNFEDIYNKQTQTSFVSEERWRVCQEFPLTLQLLESNKHSPH